MPRRGKMTSSSHCSTRTNLAYSGSKQQPQSRPVRGSRGLRALEIPHAILLRKIASSRRAVYTTRRNVSDQAGTAGGPQGIGPQGTGTHKDNDRTPLYLTVSCPAASTPIELPTSAHVPWPWEPPTQPLRAAFSQTLSRWKLSGTSRSKTNNPPAAPAHKRVIVPGSEPSQPGTSHQWITCFRASFS